MIHAKRCDYAADFEDLWLSEIYKTQPRYVIDWNSLSSDNAQCPTVLDELATSLYLTPLEWAACTAKARSHGKNHFKVVVVGNGGFLEGDRPRPLLDYYDRLDSKKINWLRVLPSYANDGEIASAFTDMEQASDIITAQIFLDQVRQMLTDARPNSDRHAITNVVGPIVLLGDTPTGSGSHSKPLLTLFRFARLLPSTAPLFDESADRPEVGTRVTIAPTASLDAANKSLAQKIWEAARRIMHPNSATPEPFSLTAQKDNEATSLSPLQGRTEKEEDAGTTTIDDSSTVIAGPSQDAPSIIHPQNGRQNIRAILVDDQAYVGWEIWLKKVLPVEVETIHEPNKFLLRILEKFREPSVTDMKYNLSLFQQKGGYNEILFLDLRLFTSINTSKEQEFYSIILQIYTAWIQNNKKIIHPWPTLSQEQIMSIQRFCDHGHTADHADYIEALTLLPRFLSLLDMSYPIVLFSSTGQAAVQKNLAPYGNIITDFEKPRFFGETPENVLTVTHAKFEKAMCRAFEILNARKLCTEIIHSASMNLKNHKCEHIEIYIDESSYPDSPYFSVVGLLVGYPDDQTPIDVNREMSKAKMKGFGQCDHNNLGTSNNLLPSGKDIRVNGSGAKGQKDRQDIILNKLNIPDTVGKILKDTGCFAVPFAFYRKKTVRHLPRGFDIHYLDCLDQLCDDNGIDNAYQALINSALETLLFEVSPKYLAKNGTMSIFCATRQRFLTFTTEEEWKNEGFSLSAKDCDSLLSKKKTIWENLFKKWGIKGSWQDKNKYYRDMVSQNGLYSGPMTTGELSYGPYFETMRIDSVYSIVDMLFKKHTHAKIIPTQIKSALAITLTAKNKPQHPEYRHIHYVADIIGHCQDISSNNIVSFIGFNDKWAPSIGTIGERCDESFRAFLTVGHLLESKNSEDSTLALLGYSLINRANKGLLDGLITGKLGHALTELTGSDFLRFIELRKSIRVGQFGTLSVQALSKGSSSR